MVAFHGSHVVVTGGTGALGSAVVAALRAAGAVCHVTNMVAALTQAIAQETSGEEIWVNAVAPSVLDTPANRAAMPDADFASWVAPSAVAEVIAFLASPDNRVTRGAIIPVYGGA